MIDGDLSSKNCISETLWTLKKKIIYFGFSIDFNPASARHMTPRVISSSLRK